VRLVRLDKGQTLSSLFAFREEDDDANSLSDDNGNQSDVAVKSDSTGDAEGGGFSVSPAIKVDVAPVSEEGAALEKPDQSELSEPKVVAEEPKQEAVEVAASEGTEKAQPKQIDFLSDVTP